MPTKSCYQCGHENPEQQSCCGTCGSPLTLNDFISKTVKEQVGSAIQGRDVLETDSAIKVFNKVWSWVRVFVGVFIAAVAIIAWQASDLWTSVKTAQESVLITQSEVSEEGASFKKDIENSRGELKAASELKSEIDALRDQLAKANSDIREEQKAISSSEEFVKSVFKSHLIEFFHIGQMQDSRYAVLPPPAGGKLTSVYFILKSTAIPETVQLQFYVSAQPLDSYMPVHNLVMFCWGDSVDALKTHDLSVSYFPDKSDKEVLHALTEHDGREFVDGEPLPICDHDPAFAGNKWLEVKDGEVTLKAGSSNTK